MKASPILPRRQMLLAAAAALTATPGAAGAADAAIPKDTALAALRTEAPLVLPRTELVYEALFDLAPTLQLGASPFGERRIVPITGGRFEGPGLRGKVMPGGADRHLVRSDGAVNLDAVYELETDDGVVLSVPTAFCRASRRSPRTRRATRSRPSTSSPPTASTAGSTTGSTSARCTA